jgi:hypothetical protein
MRAKAWAYGYDPNTSIAERHNVDVVPPAMAMDRISTCMAFDREEDRKFTLARSYDGLSPFFPCLRFF